MKMKFKFFKKMQLGLLYASALLIQINSRAQSICGGADTTGNKIKKSLTCTSNFSGPTAKYRQQSFYIPTANDPVITVKYTIHVFNDINGNGSFPNTPSGINDLQQIVNMIDNNAARYSIPRQANYSVPGFSSAYLNDSRVNYELTNIYFYNDNTLNTTDQHSALIQKIFQTDPNRIDEGLPVIFNNAPLNHGGHQSEFNHPSIPSLSLPLIHSIMHTPNNNIISIRQHLVHEIGHAMGWLHTYNTGGGEHQYGINCNNPDFLSDVFPTNNPLYNTPPLGTTQQPCNVLTESQNIMSSNNVMSGNAGMYDTQWMSPLQMGRRIRNLHLPSNNIRRYVKEMTSSVPGSWVIFADETWDFDIQMYQDIIVKSGVTLTLSLIHI